MSQRNAFEVVFQKSAIGLIMCKLVDSIFEWKTIAHII